MKCSLCNDTGHIAGRWMPEICPECSGKCEVHNVNEPEDKSAYGIVVAVAGIAFCLYLAAAWGVWSLIWAAVR